MAGEAVRSSAMLATKTMRFSIPSDFASSSLAQKQIAAEIERLGYCEAAQFAIRLALEEAIANAIKHCNKCDPQKTVLIEARITPEEAVISVEDQGGGFERQSVPDPLAQENLERCSGRGILLMESYMNQVQWSNHGRRLTMWRMNRPDISPIGCT